MSGGENEFRVRPGRARSTKAPKPKSFVALVLKAARRAGPPIQRAGNSGRAHTPGRSSFGRGRAAFSRGRLFSPTRRVVVKARVVRQQGRSSRSAPLSAHLSYLKREGVSRDGERGVMFDAASDRADDRAFAERCENDRHHFRFIVSPEDAGEMTALEAFTRDLVRQMESDLETRLDWVAVDHWNTENPHVHLLVRGVDDVGADLVISRDYISHGLHSRAEELVGIELGPRPEHAIRTALEREVDADRWTRLDVELRFAADETGLVDLRPAQAGPGDPELRRLMVGRAQKLERMGLAAPAGPGQWMVGLQAERTLRDLGARGDIIKTMHRAFAERGQDRGVGDYVIDAQPPDAPIGGTVEVRRFGGQDDPRPTLVLATRSDLDLGAQAGAPGATWLDHRLVERQPMPLAMGGFGGEVREAMKARTEHPLREGLARRQGEHVTFERDLLATLRRRELDATAARLSAETGLRRAPAGPGEPVMGVYRKRLTLSSGRFAMIDDGLGFQLVPWSPSLEKKLGQHVTGAARDDSGIEWSIGRKRGLGL